MKQHLALPAFGPILAALLALSLPLAAGAAPKPLPADAILVVGSLHDLHAREPGFGYEHLKAVLDAAAPDVLVVETRPDELAGRTATPGRPEYPAVVWPWLADRAVVVEAMEPGGERFAVITGKVGKLYAAFERDKPQAAARLEALKANLAKALVDHWRGPADAHDEVTAALVEAAWLSETALGGPGYAAAQAEWEGHMTREARRIAAAHPGRRVLILASYRNLAAFEASLRDDPRHVDAETWLRAAWP